MPHQCTNCSTVFADGSKDMLAGCPDCGGNKFQFLPPGAVSPPDDRPPDRPEAPGVAKTAIKAKRSVQDWVRSTRQATLTDTSEGGSPKDTHDSPGDTKTDRSTIEDRAQADARSDIVSQEELPDHQPQLAEVIPPKDEGRQLSLDELRDELNDQFESIKIVDRGQYELNLMELYEREEYIISLQENGRYVIEVPESVYGTGS